MTTRPRLNFRLPRWLRPRRRRSAWPNTLHHSRRTGLALEPSSYRAEVRAEWSAPGTGEPTWLVLGTFQSISPKLILRWLAGEAVRVADRLAPRPTGTPWVSPLMHAFRLPDPGCSGELRAWAADTDELHAARTHIKRGYPLYVTFTDDDDCTYTLTVWPVNSRTPHDSYTPAPAPAPSPVWHRVGGLSHPLYVLAPQDPWTSP
ncbi:hypothetical protein [Streptomyces sp. NPDC087294]|uniref:hypothetical protein n=1 Tax=Streptomyces sp. NPDC087294 TaxID=3365777 RepID=UPI0038197D3F